MFQPELMAEGVDGAAVIHKRHTILELTGTDPAVKAENDLLAMLYRRHVEFAVGHGIGVHVDVSPDPNHAVRVRTKVVPTYEIPKTTPPRPEDAEINPAFAKLEGMVLDMKLLAEANPKQYRPKLKPLVEAYQDWIDREEKRITDPAEGLATLQARRPASYRTMPHDAQADRGRAGIARQGREGGPGVPVHEPGDVAPADALSLRRAGAPGRREARHGDHRHP